MPGVMLASSTPCPSHQARNRRTAELIRPLRVRVVVLGIEEFIPGEAGRPPCPLDQHRQSLPRCTAAGTLCSIADTLTSSAAHRHPPSPISESG